MKKLFTLAFVFAGFTAGAQLQNSSMETWNTYTSDTATLEQPDHWYGSDSLVYGVASTFFLSPYKQVFQDTHAHSGTYAAKLVSEDVGGLVGVAPGVLGNGQIAVDIQNSTFSYSGGTPVTQRVIFVNAWIDYQPQGTDEGYIQVQAVLTGQGQGGVDSIVGTGEFFTDGTSGYESVSVAVDYVDANVFPDKVLITFWSSSEVGNGTEGSTMWVDDVSISTLSAGSTQKAAQSVKCYPNPSTGMVNLFSTSGEVLTLRVYSVSGQLVHTQEFKGSAQADLANLSAGMYFYQVAAPSGTILQHDKLTISK